MDNSYNKRAVFSNTFWQVVVRFVTLAITLVSIKLLTNYLGTVGIGKYNTITTYINFFIVIADLGFFAVTVREISKNPDREKKILSNVLFLRLFSALAASIAAVLIVFLTKYDSDIKTGTLIAAGFLFFNLIASVYDMALQYRLKMQFSALAELISRIISVAALFVIISKHGNFYWITGTIAIWGFFIFIFKYLFAARYVRFGLTYNRKMASWIFNMAWPLGIIFIVNNLYFKIDTLILFGIKGAAATGIYTVAYKVLDVIVFIGSYFSSALKPAISRNIGKDNEAVAKLMQKAISIEVMIAAPLAILFIAYSKDIIIFLANRDFLDSAKVLVFLALTLPLIYLDVLFLELFIASDARGIFLKISLFMFAFNVVVNAILIPRFSYFGAAFTTLLSEFMLMQIYIYYTKKIVPYRANWRVLSKIFAVTLATLVFSYVIKLSGIYFIVLMISSFIFYVFLLYLSRIFTAKDIREMLSNRGGA